MRRVLLTGDAESVAKAVVEELGIIEFEANLLPADKHDRVVALVGAKRTVAMLGDGINERRRLRS